MSKKEQILSMYYKEHLKEIDIARALGVAKSYITKIIKTSKNYFKEKERRKSENALKRKEKIKLIMRAKRKAKQELDDFVKMQHNQAVAELSYKPKLSNEDNAKCNRSAYKYDKKSSALVLRKDIKTSYAFAKKVSKVIHPSFIRAKNMPRY